MGCNCSSVNNVVKQAADLIHDDVVEEAAGDLTERTIA